MNISYSQEYISYSKEYESLKRLYLTGMMAFTSNNLAEAEKNFNEIISITNQTVKDIEPLKARAYYFLADINFIEQKFEKSIDNYKIVVQKYYSEDIYTKSLYKLGRTLIVYGRYDEGMAVLKDYLANYETNDSLADYALYWVGRAYAGKGDQQGALDSFQLVLSKYPSTTLSYELRNTIDAISKIVETKNRQKEILTGTTNSIQDLKIKNERMKQEKVMLQKMTELLLIKQRLLEIKSEKVELLSRIKDQGLR